MNRINKKQRPRSTLTERKSGGAANVVDGGVGVTINRSGAKIIIIKIQRSSHRESGKEASERTQFWAFLFGRGSAANWGARCSAHRVSLMRKRASWSLSQSTLPGYPMRNERVYLVRDLQRHRRRQGRDGRDSSEQIKIRTNHACVMVRHPRDQRHLRRVVSVEVHSVHQSHHHLKYGHTTTAARTFEPPTLLTKGAC